MSVFNDIGGLSSLLQESKAAQEANEAKFSQKPAAVAPTQVVVSNQSNSKSKSTPTYDPKDIWKPEEILTEEAIVEYKDERPTPKYEFSYKQSVGTEDTFLGMGDKTPLTSDCTHLVVKVHFPKATMKELDLDVTKNRIKVSSKTHHLYTYLPVSVDSTNGKAKFDTGREVLTVTLPIIEE